MCTTFMGGAKYPLMLRRAVESAFKWKNCEANCVIFTCKRFHATRTKLEHVGVLEDPKSTPKYEAGQTFLHRVFAYRGVILYPWTVHIYERKRESSPVPQEKDDISIMKKSEPTTEDYYQVLIDSRDAPHIVLSSPTAPNFSKSCIKAAIGKEAQSEAITFLTTGSDSSRSLYTIPGVDYVSHEDVLPYTSHENTAIQHELFEKFLKVGPNKKLTGTDTLNKWQNKNHDCLELTKVHRETTDNIRVTAMPFFLGVKESRNSQPPEYWWRYCIRIENLGNSSARLRERHWRIISNGSVKAVRGRGVIGREPSLNVNQPAFQYSSHVSLQSASGHMWGIFRFETEDGEQFDARIPAFALESKSNRPSSNNDIQ